MKILDLYDKLKKQVQAEGEYLETAKELNDRVIIQNQDKKKILIDKIEKEQAKGRILKQEDKIKLQNKILEIAELEKENRIKYKKALEEIKNKIKSTKVEKDLRNSYNIKTNLKNKIDKKK